jgi:hypothetical protein
MTEQTIEPRKRAKPNLPAEISNLTARFSEDKTKVRVSIELSHADTNPDLDLRLIDAQGKEIRHSTIIECVGPGMDFTLHLHGKDLEFPLKVSCQLSYLDDEVSSEKSTIVEEE